MINFFRKIRHNLLSAGKSQRYLKYAIGEIFLVMIGILLALQVNNWNETRKDNSAELRLFEQIIKDLEIDKRRILENIETFNEHQLVNFQILKEIKGIAKYDSTVPYYRLRQEVIDDLIVADNHSESSGNITNIQIRALIEDYFRNEARVEHALTSFANYKSNYLRPFFSRFGIHSTEFLFKIGVQSKEALFEKSPTKYLELMHQDIIDHSKLKTIYGTIELDQQLFDLGIKVYWALYTLDNLLEANVNLQQTLGNELK